MKHIIDLYTQKRYQWITENILKIDGNEVIKHLRKNHHYYTCTCQSSGSTGNASICRHKQFFIIFPFLDKYMKEFENLSNDYKLSSQMEKSKGNDKIANTYFYIYETFEKLRRGE